MFLFQLYTVSSNVMMQRSVLQLLIHLVQIRVNYCLLDSDQIFIGYVIEQFEYIEEGQIRYEINLFFSKNAIQISVVFDRVFIRVLI